MLDILGKRYIFFGLSLVLIIPGLILVAFGLPLAIDFTGGSLLEVRFESGIAPQPAEVIQLYSSLGVEDVQVQTTGDATIFVRSSFLDDTTRSQLISAMEGEFGEDITVLRFDSVGPTIGQEVTARAGMAIAVAAVAVVFYITFAFRGIQHSFRYGICAIIAMIHDVLIVLSLGAIGAYFFGWQINALFLTALLTAVSYTHLTLPTKA